MNEYNCKISSLVQKIYPYDLLEKEDIRSALHWISAESEITRNTKPDIPNKHLVVVLVVFNDKHILLGEHRDAISWMPLVS